MLTASEKRQRPMHLLALSAATKEALVDLASEYATLLQKHATVVLPDLCTNANQADPLLAHRLAVVVSSVEETQQQLAAFAAGDKSKVMVGSLGDLPQPKIGFLFTGQGSQYPGMGLELYASQPLFRETLDQCDAFLRPHMDKPLLEVLYPKQASADAPLNLINQTAYTQPCLFALEYALAVLWRSWGIQPDYMLGHSVGEYAAACMAGVFNLQDGLKLIAARGRLMQALPQGGGMLAAKIDASTAEAIIQPYTDVVSLAAINGPQSVVISGKNEALNEIGAKLEAHGFFTKALVVSHAFHSPLMEPVLDEFRKVAASITYNEPELDLVSNVTGDKVTHELTDPEYWVQHLRQPVCFNEGMQTLAKQGCRTFIEIGANPIMLGMGRLCIDNTDTHWLPSLRAKKSDWSLLLNSLGQLFVQGINPNWKGFEQGYREYQ